MLLLKVWYLWVVLGLPLHLSRKIRRDLAEPGRNARWRAGRMLFYAGILVWVPFVLFGKLLGYPVPLVPVLATHMVCLYSGLFIARRNAQPAQS